MINLIPICLIDSEEYGTRYITHYGKQKAKNMYYVGKLDEDSLSEKRIIKDNNLDYENYKEIVEKNHGYHDDTFDEIYDINKYNFVFDSKKDCEKAIEEIQALFVMKKLLCEDEDEEDN